MTHRINFQFLLCLGLVLLLHGAAIFIFNFKPSVRPTLSASDYLQYISIIPAESLPPKPTINKPSSTELRRNSVSTAPAIGEADVKDETRINLESLRTGAVEYELNREHSPQERQNGAQRRNRSLEARLGQGAHKAQRADCRKAYATAGLLAPLFITVDMLRDKGCKF